MEAARAHLHLVDKPTGEIVGDVCPGCVELSKKISVMAGKITRLENEHDELEGRSLDAKDIMDVLRFHKRILSPRARIVRSGAAWKAVKARLADMDAETDKPAFTTLHLRAAVVGLAIDDWKGREKIRAASWLFGDPDRMQGFIDIATTFRRETGVSALEIVDELQGPGLAKLAARCADCGHLRLQHEKERPELDLWNPPCAEHGCACMGWDEADWRDELFLAGRDELARRRMG